MVGSQVSRGITKFVYVKILTFPEFLVQATYYKRENPEYFTYIRIRPYETPKNTKLRIHCRLTIFTKDFKSIEERSRLATNPPIIFHFIRTFSFENLISFNKEMFSATV